MRYAIISDIHGNLEALNAVLDDIETRGVDSIICLGDIVGYYPDPEECVRLIADRAAFAVAGNHDHAVLGKVDIKTFRPNAYTAIQWTKKNLSRKSKRFLSKLPLTLEYDDMFFAHSSPSNPKEWQYVLPDSEQTVFEAFNSLERNLNFIGHTHWPSIMIQKGRRIYLHADHSFTIKKNNYYLVNVGSVGQPRDFNAASCYALCDTGEKRVNLFRVEYDFTITQNKVLANDLPYSLADRLEKGR